MTSWLPVWSSFSFTPAAGQGHAADTGASPLAPVVPLVEDAIDAFDMNTGMINFPSRLQEALAGQRLTRDKTLLGQPASLRCHEPPRPAGWRQVSLNLADEAWPECADLRVLGLKPQVPVDAIGRIRKELGQLTGLPMQTLPPLVVPPSHADYLASCRAGTMTPSTALAAPHEWGKAAASWALGAGSFAAPSALGQVAFLPQEQVLLCNPLTFDGWRDTFFFWPAPSRAPGARACSSSCRGP